MSHSPTPFVLLHGAFARPAKHELMELAALGAGQPPGAAYFTRIRCDVPDTPQGAGEEGGPTGVTPEENAAAPPPAEVLAQLAATYGLDEATTVVFWGNMAFRFFTYTQSKGLGNPLARCRVLDLQAAAALFLDLKTADCKSPQNLLRILNLNPKADCWSKGSQPYVNSMHAVLGRMLERGWTLDATPSAIIPGSDLGEAAEEQRLERWEQLREKQGNLGIERRPVPGQVPAYIILDGEHVSLRHERFHRVIEVALVVAGRQAEGGYQLTGEFTSLVQLLQIEASNPHAWRMTGIDPEAVRRAPPLRTVMAAMQAAAPWDTGVLVIWGPDDARIITHHCANTGVPSPVTEVPLLDLQRAYSRFYGLGQQQVGLQNAAAQLGIDFSDLDMHRALSDAIVTWRVLERMLADGWTPQWRSWQK